MLTRFFSGIIGLVLLGIVIYLGFQAATDPVFVIWFGLAVAILPGLSYRAVRYAFIGSEGKVLKYLSKLPEVEKRIQQAKSLEERIKVLEEERAQIAEVVELESQRQALLEGKRSLEQDAARILNKLQAIDSELGAINMNVQSSPVSQQVQSLHERLQVRQRGDIVIRLGSRYYSIDRDLVLGLFPLGFGRLLLCFLRFYDTILSRQRKSKDKA